MIIGQYWSVNGNTGGYIRCSFTMPDGTYVDPELIPGTSGSGTFYNLGYFTNTTSGIIQPGTTVQVYQASAMTAGDATVWAELWAL